MELDYKLICMDLDGTLLDIKHKINPYTLDILNKLEKKGIKLAIATGRDGFDAKHHAQIVSDECYYIGSNGAVVGESNHNKLLAENVIAIEDISKVLEFAKDQVIAFGDSENDREMLKFVGLGIAMENASASIKSIADQVTLKNTDDGVAKKLEELFFLT